jgi:uncharacterized protein YndB with AHSA1/START domain
MQAEPTPDGTVERHEDGKTTIRFERRIEHGVERVWAAITEPEQMLRWWGEAEVELVEGGRFRVRWLNTDDEGNVAEMEARITRLEPQRLLETDGGIHGRLRWELEPSAGGTVLRFSSTVELPDEFRTKVVAGWHFHLDALAEVLGGGSVDIVHPEERWEPIHQRYAAELA